MSKRLSLLPWVVLLGLFAGIAGSVSAHQVTFNRSALSELSRRPMGEDITTADDPLSPVIINEIDSDTPGSDTLEFVELYDGGAGNTSLNGLVLVFFNGADNASYYKKDLYGLTTGADGYFVIGNSDVDNRDEEFSKGLLQNGADAVALFVGNGSDFPNDTPVTTTNLVDAIVYDTGQGDDAGLLVLLNSGQPQVDEAAGGDEEMDSNQRCPNGSGGHRNTVSYVQAPPSPGVENNCTATAVTLASFTAEPHPEGVLLQWVTATEIDNAGFNLHRATAENGPYTPVNPALIPAKGDAVTGPATVTSTPPPPIPTPATTTSWKLST